MKDILSWVSCALLIASASSGQVTIEIGSVEFSPGGEASFDVAVRTAEDNVGGTGNSIGWSGPFRVTGCIANPDIGREATAFAFTPAGCEADESCSGVRSLVLSFGIPALPPPLQDGEVLYSCSVRADADAADGDYPLSCSGGESATLQGVPIETDCSDGVVMVREPTPTPTVTPTAGAATPTSTQFGATATATLDLPTETPTPLPCPGDCDGDRAVAVSELVSAVRITLGDATVDMCPAADPNGDMLVGVNELVRGVRASLDGCP